MATVLSPSPRRGRGLAIADLRRVPGRSVMTDEVILRDLRSLGAEVSGNVRPPPPVSQAVGRLGSEHLLGCSFSEFGFFDTFGGWHARRRLAGFAGAIEGQAGRTCHVYEPTAPGKFGSTFMRCFWGNRTFPSLTQYHQRQPALPFLII